MLWGLAAVAAYLGVHPATVQRWRSKHGFPICAAPDGQMTTTRSLIDQWILARNEQQRAPKQVAPSTVKCPQCDAEVPIAAQHRGK